MFEFTLPDLGDIKRIGIGHDGVGEGSGWHCQEVKIETSTGRCFVFPCNAWLDSRQGDGLTERELTCKESRVSDSFKFKDFIGSKSKNNQISTV
jgi:hypothetical protein